TIESTHGDRVDENQARGRFGGMIHDMDESGTSRMRARTRLSLDGHSLARLSQIPRRERADREAEDRGTNARGASTPRHGEKRTERRPHHDAEARRRAEPPETLRAVTLAHRIRDVRLEYADGAAADALHEPRNQKQRQRVGEREDDVG